MKWLVVLFVVCLVVELPVRTVHASSEETDQVESDGLPPLKLKFLEDENNKLDSSSDDSVAETAVNAIKDGNETAEASEHVVPLIAGVNPLEEEISDNELTRVKKSNSLTTICVEIKPTSPYEPPYFMCRGTEPQYYGKGGHKTSSHGGSGGAYKPSIHQGDGYGTAGDHTPSNEYSYGKPGHSGGYGSQEEYSSGGHGTKPNAEKYSHGVSGYGGYVKPSTSGGGYRPDGGHGGYGIPSGHNLHPPSHAVYAQGGGAEYSKPTKYQMTHDSYGPSVPSSHVKPIKLVIPTGGSYDKPDVEIYDAHSQSYGRPGSSYGPAFNSYGASQSIKHHGGGSMHSYSGSSGAPYGPTGYGYGLSRGYGSPDVVYNPSYKTKVLPLHHKKTSIGKYPKKHYGGGKKGYGFSSGGYRTTEEDDDDDDEEEMEFQDEMPVGPQLQSPYHPGMSYNYGVPPPYYPRPAPIQSLPQTYTYPSPAPQVPCGSNLLFGCHPNVAPVPCYGKGAVAPPQPAPVVYNYPAVQPASLVYGQSIPQQPMVYYPNLGSIHQVMPAAEAPSGPNGIEQPKNDISDNQNFQQRTQSETEADTNMRSQGNINMNDQNNMMKDENSKPISETKPKNPSSSTEQFPPKTHINHAEMVRNAENAQNMNAENKMSSIMNMDNTRQNGPGQDPDIKKNTDDEEAKKRKIDAMMRMQHMKEMTHMMSGTPEGTHMRRDSMTGMNGAQSW